MGSTAEHQKIVDEVLLAIGSRADGRAWKNVTGVAKQGTRVISFGLKGSADVFAIKAPQGRFFAFEAKSGKAVQSREQRAFGEMVTRFGGVYAVVRSGSEALQVWCLHG